MHSESEHLLTCLAEECMEIVEAAIKVHYITSKAIRFGPEEVQYGRPYTETNASRLLVEINDFIAVIERIHQKTPIFDRALVNGKHEKLSRYVRLARKLGTLEAEKPEPKPEGTDWIFRAAIDLYNKGLTPEYSATEKIIRLHWEHRGQ